MKNRKGRGLVWKVFLICFLTLLMNKGVYAADFNAAVSSAAVTQGDTVTVTVTFSSNANIGAYAMRLTYDPGILEYSSGADGGGGGTLQFYNDYVNSTSKSYTISFQAKAAGTSALSLEAISVPCDTDANDMTVKASGGSVTVAAPAAYSSNNNLAALNVALVYSDGTTQSASLSPAFSADITSYHLSVGENVERLSLDASAADGKAAVNVSGTRMDPGSNTTTISVTAENGDVKKYVIYTEKAQAATTQPETTTEPQTTAEPETTTEPQTTVPEDQNTENPLEVEINGSKYIVTSIPEGTDIPEGYETVQIDYKGVQITALQGLSTNLQLLYLVNAETKEGDFYIYSKEMDSYALFICLTVRQHMYAVLDIPENVTLPYGGKIGSEYKLTTIEINGKTAQALAFDAEGMYLVYAMNWNGDYNLYFYDSKEGTMLRYVYSELEKNPGAVQQASADTSLSDNEKKALQQSIDMRNLLIIILIVVIIFLTGAILITAIMIRKQKHGEEEDDEYEEDEEYMEGGYEEADGSLQENDIEEEDSEPMDEEKLDQALDDILKENRR